jgi:hypothetical protein
MSDEKVDILMLMKPTFMCALFASFRVSSLSLMTLLKMS